MTNNMGFAPGDRIRLDYLDGGNLWDRGVFVGWLPIGLVWKQESTELLLFTPVSRILEVRQLKDGDDGRD